MSDLPASKHVKVLIVEDDESLRGKISSSFKKDGENRFDVSFISCSETGNPSGLDGTYSVVMVDFAPDPKAALQAAWRLRASMPESRIAALTPSENFMAPMEALNIGLGALVVLDDKGISSLPSVALSMLERRGQGDRAFSTKNEKLSYQELQHITTSLARQSVSLIMLRNELAAEKSKMETVINGMTDGVVFFNMDGEPEMINPVAGSLFPDLRPNEGPSLSEFISKLGEDGEFHEKHKSDVCDMFDADIGSKTYRVRVAEVKDSEGHTAGTLALLTDITQDKEYERLKNEFTSMISHELRTPLTSIRAAVDNFIRGVLGDVTESQKKFLQLIARNVDRQQELIDNLLDLARLEAGQMELNIEPTNAAAPAHFCVDQFSLAYKDKGVTLKSDIGQDLPKVRIDQGLFAQAVNNLLSNALKFTDSGGEVTLSLKSDIHEDTAVIKLTVADTGIGIPKESIDRIFSKYTQADSSIRRRYAGTGLGLAICKEIAKAHGGWVEVESEQGKGSRFSLIIPVPES